MPTDHQIESELQNKGLTAPRVTPADIEAEISFETFFTAHEGTINAYHAHGDVPQSTRHDDNVAETPLRLLTFCVLVLKNGFTVTGESACASPENFDAEIGRKIARANAVAKIWPLLGFRLRDQLAHTPTARYRSAETGEYVTQEFAEQNPATTYRESGRG